MNNSDFFHGAVLSKIIDNKFVRLGKYIRSNSSYIIDDKIVIYIKYSQKEFLRGHSVSQKYTQKNSKKLKKIISVCLLFYSVMMMVFVV